MHRRNTPAILFLTVLAGLSAINTTCIAQNQPSSIPPSSATNSEKDEGCKLHPYTGTTPLDQIQDYFQGEQDLRGGMTCMFSISPHLPLFTFYFPGKPDNTLGDIQITEATKNEVIQTIENSTDAGFINPARAQDVLAIVDANFDGYKDLQILSNCGATGNCSYDFYLYDPASMQFVHNKFLTDLSTPSFDDAKKQVTSTSNSSASDWETQTYQYQDGQYTLIWKQQSVWDRDKQTVTVSTYELRDGKMELTNSETGPE